MDNNQDYILSVVIMLFIELALNGTVVITSSINHPCTDCVINHSHTIGSRGPKAFAVISKCDLFEMKLRAESQNQAA